MSEIRLRVGAWYEDREIALPVPDDWDVDIRRPATPAPICEAEIERALLQPVAQRPLSEVAAGCRRPVVILDDLTRPTPAGVVIPYLLSQLRAAGIPPAAVTLLMGGGTHQPAPVDSVRLKAGPEAGACRLVVHDPGRGVTVGRTSFGTPVIVDPEVARADLVIGVGGVYPQHSVGFGGGSKLLLGVLQRRSIVGLHYGHSSVGGRYSLDNDFRRDLDEIAVIAGMRWTVTLHVDADRRVVRAVAGDPLAYHAEAAAFSLAAYEATLPGDADVVIANAYPMDVSLTFARSKGLAPLHQERCGASRILIAACPEGLGRHGLFPYLNGPSFERQRHLLRRLSVVKTRTLPAKALGRLRRRRPVRPAASVAPAAVVPAYGNVPARQPVRLYLPGGGGRDLDPHLEHLHGSRDWSEVVAAITTEQDRRERLSVAVYTCSPLQCLAFTGTEDTAFLAQATA